MNCKKKKKIITRIVPAPEKPVRILGPEDKAALTCGRLSGRSSLKQQDFLVILGVPREQAVSWTKYRASQEISKRLADQHTRKEQPAAVSGR